MGDIISSINIFQNNGILMCNLVSLKITYIF
jgi:hypothetical protein